MQQRSFLQLIINPINKVCMEEPKNEILKEFKEILLRFYLVTSSRHLPQKIAQNNLIKLFRLDGNPPTIAPPAKSQSKPKSEVSPERGLEAKTKSENNIQQLKITINGENVRTTIDTNRSKSREKSASKSQTSKIVSGFGPLFHTEWVYSSKDPGKVIAFAYLAVCILRDYKFGFDKLYAMIKDHLREQEGGVPGWAQTAYRQWETIRDQMTRNNGVKWQRALRNYIDSLTDIFTNMVAMLAASPVESGTPFSLQAAKRLAFSAETSVVYFTVNYKQMPLIQRVMGSKTMQISLGFLQHCGVYVVAAHPPSLSHKESDIQALKGMLGRSAESALQELQLSEQRYQLEKYSTFLNQKQGYIKKYLNKKLTRYGLDQ